MRCYYEELNIPRNSTDADIKTAYRKLALRWHPDKNPDSLDEAKERFQLIQQAYDVLSDPQERAWYDNHREQILRGKNSEYEDKSLDVFQYFTSSCYKGYGDDPNGFYSVYRDVFQKLIDEDAKFIDDADEISAIPNFGNSESNYEEVVGKFYAYWLAYSTKKTYEWLCPYDILEIKDRYILRKVEKEMKKIVQKARKDRNEEVRNLVSFVRKRDRRVHAYRRVLEERAEQNRQKQEEKRLEQLRRRQQDLVESRKNNSAFSDAYEEQLRQIEREYHTDDEDNKKSVSDKSESDLDETFVNEEYVDDLYCVACNKSFTNANAFANHEDSKKHRENVERLKLEMTEEQAAYNKDADDINEAEIDVNLRIAESLEDMQLNENDTNDMEPENVQTQKRNKKQKKLKKVNKENANNIRDAEVITDVDEQTAAIVIDFTPDNSDVDEWNNSNKKNAKKNRNKRQANNYKVDAETRQQSVNKPIDNTISTNKDVIMSKATVIQHICATCKSCFESKNKLFAHLKKTNHGVYIPKAQPVVDGKPSRAKGRRK